MTQFSPTRICAGAALPPTRSSYLAYEQAAGHAAPMLWELDEGERIALSTRAHE